MSDHPAPLDHDPAKKVEQIKDHVCSISHDLRGSLHFLTNIGATLAREGASAETIAQVETAVDQMDRLLLDLTEGLRDPGRLSLHPQPMHLARWMRALVVHYRNLARRAGLNFNFEPRNLDFVVQFDRYRLHQLLTNLVSNAVKYTPAGSVRFAAKLDVSQGAAVLTVEVADTGVGIAETDQTRIFEQHTRLREDLAEGEGLGLAIVAQLVTQAEGTIKVTSRLGEGSCFTLTLPMPVLCTGEEASGHKTLF